MKKTHLLMVCFFVLGIIVGLLISQTTDLFMHKASEKSLLEKIKERGELIVGTSADWPPWEYVKNGKIVGIDIEIAKKIAEKIGVKLTIKDMKFSALIEALRKGEVDLVIADMTPTAEREKIVDFSIPYYVDAYAVVTVKGKVLKSVEDLYGKTVGVQLGTTQQEWAEEKLKGKAKILTYDKVFPDMVMVLKRGDVDVIIVSKMVASLITSKDPDLVTAFVIPGTEGYAAIAMPQGAEDLKYIVNKVVEELMQSGELDKIIQTEVEAWLSG